MLLLNNFLLVFKIVYLNILNIFYIRSQLKIKFFKSNIEQKKTNIKLVHKLYH